MSSQHFIDTVTPIQAEWLNEVNDSVHQVNSYGTGVSAITEMADDLGYVRFPVGEFHVPADVTISVPVYFDYGASISVDSGKTVTFSETFINAPRQQIFSGAGTVLLTGERTVQAMAEWWGVIPGLPAQDQASSVNKMFASCPAARECYITWGPGSFYFSTAPNTVPRAVRMVGSGERLTNIVFMGALQINGDFFVSGGEGVTLENFQFTCTDGLSQRTSGSLIVFNHNFCVAKNIWSTDAFVGIKVAGNANKIDKITSFRQSTGAGSCLVWLAGGFSTAVVNEVRYVDSSTHAVENAVRVDNHSFSTINNVFTSGAKSAVGIVPSTGTAKNIDIGTIVATGSTGTNALLIQSTGTGSIESITASSVMADGLLGCGIKVQKDGSGILKYLDFGSLQARACAVAGFKVDASTGSVDHWHLRGGFARNGAGDGYDIANSDYWTLIGCESTSNTGTGTIIANGCTTFICTNNRNLFNTAAQLTDNSGAVTKVVANNL